MIVVHAIGEAGVQDFGLATGGGELLDVAVAIEEKIRTITRPVGGFEVTSVRVNDVADGRFNRDRFQIAVENWRGSGRCQLLDFNV